MRWPGILLLLACHFLAACGTVSGPVAARPQPRELTFIQPWLLYTAATPCRSLTVEIDAVAGAEPPEAWLTGLRSFLAANTHKPGGIRIHRSDVIPQSVARTSSSSALALRYINGPGDSSSAFLYVLYYHSGLNPALKTANPHAVAFPYPAAIFIDRNYNDGGFGDRMGAAVLQHEAGHIIGAARDTSHGDGAHCRNENCLMSPVFEYNPLRRWVGLPLAPQQKLCAECTAELSRWRATPPARHIGFAGPLFRRNEGSYQVLSLPGAIHLHCGPAGSLSPSQVLRTLRHAASAGLRSKEGFILSAAANGEPLEVSAALKAAQQDPATPVRHAAALLKKQIKL